jgi:threonine aldolase
MMDLHSDTVTKPTREMREAMMAAEVGDDVCKDDPTMNILEARVATMFGKEAALFFPSGTMSNLTAAMVWCCDRGSEMIVGDKSHMFLFEQGGVAQFGGITTRSCANLPDGSMDLMEIQRAIRDNDIHEPMTRLICIENTHNACGGTVLPISFLEHLQELALKHNLPIHMDGARIWNALTATGQSQRQVAQYVDSLSVCLSKGLGCPVGSLLIGSHEFIEKARRIRKGLGGGMRQAGILAAAGLVGLDDFERGILKRDHMNCRRIADAIVNVPIFRLMNPIPQTNMLFIEILVGSAQDFVDRLMNNHGILLSAWSLNVVRIVVHRDIDDAMIEHVIYSLQRSTV